MKQFLGFLPLNVGLNILVASYISTALNTALINSTDYNSKHPASFIISNVLCFYMVVTWIAVFIATYEESINIIKIALNMWILFTIAWFILALGGLTDNFESHVCMCTSRCAESLWLFKNEVHNVCPKKPSTLLNKNQLHLNTLTGSINSNDLPPKTQASEMNINHYYLDYTILSIAIVLPYLVIGILTLSSYLEELNCYKCRKCPIEVRSNVPKVPNKVMKDTIMCCNEDI